MIFKRAYETFQRGSTRKCHYCDTTECKKLSPLKTNNLFSLALKMEEYLKDSNETRNLEQKVYELDVQRYKLIIKAYKEKVDDLEKSHKRAINDITKELQAKHDFEMKAFQREKEEDLEKLRLCDEEKIKSLEEEINKLNLDLKEIKNLKDEKASGDSEIVKSLRNELKELKKAKIGKENAIIEDLKSEIKELTKNVKNKEQSGDFTLLKVENENYKVKVDLLNDRCKTLEKEIKDLKLSSKKKEDQWFKSIFEQNQKILDKDESKYCEISKEINEICAILKNQNNGKEDEIVESLKTILKELLDDALTKGDQLKDKTIKTLKASNDLKTKIIKKQVEKLTKEKKKQLSSESSEDTIIKPEDDNSSVVFGLGDLATKKETIEKVKPKIEQNKKKVKTNTFDDAVLKSAKSKKPLPVVKKPNLPKDAQKMNNASFFANITFTDSSPVIKRDGNKKQ